MIVEVESQEHFETLVDESPRVVVDFWADWCGPCKQFKPHFEAVAEGAKFRSDLLGLTTFVSVDVDNQPWVMQEFGIQSVPTVLLIENDQVTPVKGRTIVQLLNELS